VWKLFVLEWRVKIVCVGIKCGNCVCWNGVWKLCVFEWSVGIECVLEWSVEIV
jgi:hypothetical protein